MPGFREGLSELFYRFLDLSEILKAANFYQKFIHFTEINPSPWINSQVG